MLIQVSDGTWLDPFKIVSIRAFKEPGRAPFIIVTTSVEYSYVRGFETYEEAIAERDKIAVLVNIAIG